MFFVMTHYTHSVQADIKTILQMSDEHLFSVVHPFNRDNLFYEVSFHLVHLQSLSPISSMKVRPIPTMAQESQFEHIHTYIRSLTERRGRPSAGIIYARTRATCDDLSIYLRRKGLAARPYHRGMHSQRLDMTLQEWLDGEGLWCDWLCTV